MNQEKRHSLIVRTSFLGILVNLAFAVLKIVIGLISSSLAIISEGTNNATDAASSLLTLIGTKLSAKHPDQKHPFGYGRIEYMTGLVIGVLVLYTGIELAKDSIDAILHPSEMSVSVIMIVLVAISAVIKFLLGIYTIRTGKKTDSDALVAVGQESRNDAVFSVVTIAVTLVYLFTNVSLDAYAGILFALVILKSALETLKDTVSELLGRPGKEELAKNIYREVRTNPYVINAADLMLHNYGPDEYSGSINIEIDHQKTIGEIYQSIHALQLKIMHEYRVTMVFGIYAVDNKHEGIQELRKRMVAFIREHPHIKSYHALYVESGTEKIYCDLVVDYDLQDWNGLDRELKQYLNSFYPGRDIELTIETEYV